MKRTYKLIFFIIILCISNITNAFAKTLSNDIELVAGMKLEKKLSATEEHIYIANLENGMAIIGEVIQDGIDIVVDVYTPKGILLKQIDSPNGKNGAEPIDITANESGIYKFIIRTLDKNAEQGTYLLKVEEVLALMDNAKRIAKKEFPTKTLYDLWESSLTNPNEIDTFINKLEQQHIIEPLEGNDTNMLVTYFCVPDKDTEYAMQSGGPDFLGLRFQRLGNTKLFFVTQLVPKDARFNYGFNYFKVYHAGPNNEIERREVDHVYDGTVVMPDAPKELYISERKGVSKGKLMLTSIKSKFLNEDRKITIHTPANYDPKTPHNLLIVFDGESYGGRPNRRSRIPTPTILDNLKAENKITPTVTVLVWSMRKRTKDLISDTFSNFIAQELIPYMRSEYNIHKEAKNVVLAGSSRGGYAASFIAFNHSDVIGTVLSQSGSYWIKATDDENHWIYPKDTGKLITAFKNSKKLPIRFYMEIGLYDAGASMLGTNRELRDILEIKGYEIDYREFNGGHNYVNWRGSLANGLMSLLGQDKK
ncbi:alpha/beta hydrolase [Aquimarina rubra]|uniref:Alpha/beta hydrolase n=1 Tax=Aquimarina rubra TaxID=1920033 RepID=A0ABW5LC70_9FLAO